MVASLRTPVASEGWVTRGGVVAAPAQAPCTGASLRCCSCCWRRIQT
ncbi:hypothetical protein HaLaN_25145, partial [Haematococcus lacustris]